MERVFTVGAFLLLGVLLAVGGLHLRRWFRLAPEQRRVRAPRWLLAVMTVGVAALVALAYVVRDNIAATALVAAAIVLLQIIAMRHASG